MAKTKFIHIRASEDFKERIKKVADYYNTNPTTYCNNAINIQLDKDKKWIFEQSEKQQQNH